MSKECIQHLQARYEPGIGMFITVPGLTILLPEHLSVLAIQRHIQEVISICS